VSEVISPAGTEIERKAHLDYRELTIPMIRGGQPVDGPFDLNDARELHREARTTLPWEGLALSKGDAAIPTQFVGFPEPAE